MFIYLINTSYSFKFGSKTLIYDSMEKKLSIISFDLVSEPEPMSTSHYVLTNSSAPPSPSLSNKYPYLLKGMIFGIHLRGESRLKIDLKEYTLKPNTIFTILPNQIFESIEDSHDNYVEILLFSVDFMSDLPLPKNFDVLNNMKFQPCLEVSDEYMNEIIEYHAFITKACSQQKHIHRKEIVESLLCALIALISSLYAEKKENEESMLNTRGEEIVNDFSDLLMQYHRNERSASFYADKMCITAPYLSRTLKNMTGRSISTWINEAVILDAKALLKSTNMTVMQISEELNFPNPSFFGRFFKQYAGITPLKYKKS